MIQPADAIEDTTAEHRFTDGTGHGSVVLVKVRNAYQGMVTVRTATGDTVAVLLGDLTATR